MSRLARMLDALFGAETKPTLTDEDLKLITQRLSKLQLQFSDDDIKRIARTITDTERDVDRLASSVMKSGSFKRSFLVFCLLTLIGVTTAVYFYARSFSNQVTTTFDTQYNQFTNSIQKSLESSYKDITNTIAKMLQTESMSNVMVSVVNDKATNLLWQQIRPFEDTLTNSMANLRGQISSLESEATTNVAELKGLADFYLIVAGAEGYSTDDFFKLVAISDTNTNTRASLANHIASSIGVRILRDYSFNNMFTLAGDPWQGTGTSSDKASFEEYVSQFNAPQSILSKIVLIHQFGAQSRFDLEKRLNVLSALIRSERDLLCLQEECALMAKDAKLDVNYMGYRTLLDWYDKHRKSNQPAH